MSSLWGGNNARQNILTDRNPSPRDTRNTLCSVKDKSHYFLSKGSIKGTSLLTFFIRPVKGSMTVEASIVLPMFLFFFLNLSCGLEMMRLHGNLQLALWEVGNRLSVYGYALEQDLGDEKAGRETSLGDKLLGAAFSYGYIRSEMVKYAGEAYLNASPMTYGADGLQFLESEIFGNGDEFEVIVTYAVSPWTKLAGFRSFRMANRYYGHIWNGYEIPAVGSTRPEDRDTVYVTEKGTVYHEDLGCRHLKVTVQEILQGDIESYRNESGGRYTLCEKCDDKKASGTVYITEDGNRFHYGKDCSGLKRTVYSVLRVTVKDYPACKRCSAGD